MNKIKQIRKRFRKYYGENIKELFLDNTQIMTVFQETVCQEEPDICAVDKEGNLILFELKRHTVSASTTIQILKYVEIFG